MEVRANENVTYALFPSRRSNMAHILKRGFAKTQCNLDVFRRATIVGILPQEFRICRSCLKAYIPERELQP